MGEKILPVKMPNDFLAYKPFDASRLSILLAQEKYCREVYENFISFRIEKNVYASGIYLECHYNEEFSNIGVKKVPVDILMDLEIDFIHFCKTSLENNYYIFLPIETSAVSNYVNYKKESVYHHIFIYGYNDNTQTFYCSEFFSYGEEPYASQSVSYREMEEGFYCLQGEVGKDAVNKEASQWLKDIQLLHVYSEYQDRFTIKRLINSLQYFLSEKDCYGNKDYLKDVYYGFAIYDLLIDTVLNLIEQSLSYSDSRCIKVLHDRFHYMVLQTEFLKENYTGTEGIEQFKQEYSELYKISNNTLGLCYKYFYKNDYSILDRILEKLRLLKEMDYTTTSRYIEFLISIDSRS